MLGLENATSKTDGDDIQIFNIRCEEDEAKVK